MAADDPARRRLGQLAEALLMRSDRRTEGRLGLPSHHAEALDHDGQHVAEQQLGLCIEFGLVLTPSLLRHHCALQSELQATRGWGESMTRCMGRRA
jgi:hypothetical protein